MRRMRSVKAQLARKTSFLLMVLPMGVLTRILYLAQESGVQEAHDLLVPNVDPLLHVRKRQLLVCTEHKRLKVPIPFAQAQEKGKRTIVEEDDNRCLEGGTC